MNDPTPGDPLALTAAPHETSEPEPGPPRRREPASRTLLALAAIAALLALGVSVWQWHDTRTRIAELTESSARRLAEIETRSKESRLLADQAREATTAAQVKIGVLEAKLAESPKVHHREYVELWRATRHAG